MGTRESPQYGRVRERLITEIVFYTFPIDGHGRRIIPDAVRPLVEMALDRFSLWELALKFRLVGGGQFANRIRLLEAIRNSPRESAPWTPSAFEQANREWEEYDQKYGTASPDSLTRDQFADRLAQITRPLVVPMALDSAVFGREVADRSRKASSGLDFVDFLDLVLPDPVRPKLSPRISNWRQLHNDGRDFDQLLEQDLATIPKPRL